MVEELAALVAGHYVFAEPGARIAGALRERLADGAYGTASLSAEQLADHVTADLQSLSGDPHLSLKHHAVPVPPGQSAAVLAAMRRDAALHLGGAPRVQRLDGGVALLELGPALYPLEWSAPALSAALTLVAGAPALVIDLRGNLGGDPMTVAFVCGYLLDEPTHLQTMYGRDDERGHQSWSPAYVPGECFGGSKPLYVLTSARTFSAGEELAYDLQHLGRAQVVGEVTRGGAHPREGWTLHPHLEASVPVGRSAHPRTGADWEGVGVRPDVPVAAEAAEARAHELALARIA